MHIMTSVSTCCPSDWPLNVEGRQKRRMNGCWEPTIDISMAARVECCAASRWHSNPSQEEGHKLANRINKVGTAKYPSGETDAEIRTSHPPLSSARYFHAWLQLPRNRVLGSTLTTTSTNGFTTWFWFGWLGWRGVWDRAAPLRRSRGSILNWSRLR